MQVLVVDDDAALRLLVRSTLELHGYQVHEACDGVEALEIFRKQSFDAVLLDVNMPRLNGLETLEQIKSESPATLCIVLTAYSDVKDAVQAIKQGAYDYLEKPVDGERIMQIFESAKRATHMVQIAAFSAPQAQFEEGRSIIGESSSIQRVFGIIHKL